MLIIHYMYLNICQAMRGVGSVWGEEVIFGLFIMKNKFRI